MILIFFSRKFWNQHAADFCLSERVDLQLHFMHPSSHHFSYYQHLVRMCQWELAQKMQEEPAAVEQVIFVSTFAKKLDLFCSMENVDQ